jgi:hypothetical protein
MAGIRDVTIYWHPWHEVVPGNRPGQDFLAFDEGTDKDVGRVYEMAYYVVAGA